MKKIENLEELIYEVNELIDDELSLFEDSEQPEIYLEKLLKYSLYDEQKINILINLYNKLNLEQLIEIEKKYKCWI